MAKYTRITYNERCRIRQYLKEGLSQQEIADSLRRSKSTISSEIRRKGMTADSYNPIHAQADVKFKRGLIKRNRKIKGALEASIQLLLLERRWSPEQISCWLKIHYPSIEELHISPEAIYKYIYRSPNRNIYIQALRKKRKYRRRRSSKGLRRGGIRNRVSIRERDPKVKTRDIPGHWEGDLIIGKNNKSAIGTLVERSSRFVKLTRPATKTSDSVVSAFVATLKDLPHWLKRSLTYDQGSEMAQHERFTHETGIQVYFADPGSPWQRGSNENTNGLLREFFPKKTDLSLVSDNELRRVENLLNSRPRKILGYATPAECLDKFKAQQEKKKPVETISNSVAPSKFTSFKNYIFLVFSRTREFLRRPSLTG